MVVELCSSADLMAQLQLRITAAVYFNEEHLHDMVVQVGASQWILVRKVLENLVDQLLVAEFAGCIGVFLEGIWARCHCSDCFIRW